MQSILNVLQNRARKRGTSVYLECVRALQFSSMTAKGDPELTLWPADDDPQWQTALGLAAQASAGALPDLTGGATLYYAPKSIQSTAVITLPTGETVPFPQGWNWAAVIYTATIAEQVFFRELVVHSAMASPSRAATLRTN
jgi:hypothetical protein